MIKQMLISAVAGLASLTLTMTAQAASVGFDVSPTTTDGQFSAGNYVQGFRFEVASGTVSVTGLAAMDRNSDGLTGDTRVGLWSDDGTLLADIAVTNASGVIQSGNTAHRWLFEPITELVLGVGAYRVAALADYADNNWSVINGRVSNLANASITGGYYRTEFPNGGFAFPDVTFSTQPMNATIVTGDLTPPAAVPVPAAALLFAPAAFLAARRRKAA